MNTSELILVRPTKAMEQEITEYKEEHFRAGDMQVHGSGGLAYFDSFDEILKALRWTATPGDIILTVGAGDIYKVGERLVGK